MAEYKNKSVQEIKKMVGEEFDRIGRIWYRDDQEIYEAGQNVINTIIKQIKEDKKKGYGPWALSSLNDLHKEYREKFHEVKSKGKNIKNQALINNIAHAIDTAENTALDRLSVSREMAVLRNASQAQEKIGKKYFQLEKNGTMTLLKDVNAPKIHEVLSNLGLQKGKSYEIDYTNCKNPTIKNKMIGLTGAPKVVLQYNGTTYTLRDMYGNDLPHERALVWEGVTLKSTAISAAQQKVKNAENRGNALDPSKNRSAIGDLSFSAIESDPKWKGIMSLLKEKSPKIYKKLQEGSQNQAKEYIHKFLTATENRIDEISKYARKYNYVFMPESMSKTWGFSDSLLEVHLIARDGSAKEDMNFFDDDTLLGETVYDILDENENEYMEFVKAWIADKFNGQYAKYAKTEKINLSLTAEEKKEMKIEKQDEVEFAESDKQWLLDGLHSLKQTLLNAQEDYGSTWLGDDKKVQEMIYHLENAIATIEDVAFPLSKRWFNKKVIDPLHKSWTKSAWTGVGTVSKGFNLLKKGNKTEFIQGIRKLGGTLTNLANTHTTHLADDIVHDNDIELRDSEMEKYFKAIKTKLAPDKEGNLSSWQKQLIDSLYNAMDGSAIATILQKNSLLPSFDKLSQKNQEKFIKACGALKGSLEQQNRALDALSTQVTDDYLASMKEHNEERKSQLVAKGETRTEAENKELQVLYVIEENPHLLVDVATNALKETRDNLKYFGVDSMILGVVGPALIEQAGGLKGDKGNGTLYNDIKGLGGWFEWSDENVAFVQQIAVMIAEELVFMAVAAALTATTGVGGPALIAARIGAFTAKLAKLGSKALKFKKIAGFMKLPRMSNLAAKFKGISSGLNKGKDLARITNTGANATKNSVKAVDKATDLKVDMKTQERIKKIYKLSEQGSGGEKANAIKFLNSFKKKYNLSDDDVLKIVNAGTNSKKLATTGSNMAKTADTGSDLLRIGGAANKARYGQKSMEKMKKIFQKLGYKDAMSVFKSLDKTIAKGLIHTGVSKAYRGEIDDDLNTWITDGLHTTGMYAILGVVGRVAKAGVLGKSAMQAVENNTFSVTKFFAEELSMFGVDMGIDLTMGTDPMPTQEEIAQNFALGLGAEILPGVGGSLQKFGNKVKSIHITKNTVTVNGIKYQKEQLANLIAESYKNAKRIELASSSSAIVKNTSGTKANTPSGVLSWDDALKMSKIADEDKIMLNIDIKVDESLKEVGVDLKKVPQTLTDARTKTERFGYWLGKNMARLDHAFYVNASRWLDKILLYHPQLGLSKVRAQLKQLRDRLYASKGEMKKKSITKDGRTYEGEFYRSGVLKNGKRISPAGRIEEGQFDESGVLREGKGIQKDGTIYEGKFDKKGLLENGLISNSEGIRYYVKGYKRMETNPDKRARREKALQDGHLGFHGTNIEFDANTKLKPFAGTSKAFDGVSIARDKEIAIGYALRSLIQKQSGLEFRKGFEVNWNSTTKKYVLSIEGKSKDQVLAMLKNFKQTDFFIYELAKQEDRWGGVRNKNFGLFEMATNQTDTEWLTREKISLWDLINHGDMEIEGVSKNMNSTNPDYFGKEARIYTTIDAQQAHRNSQFMDNAFEGIYHKSANEVVLLVNELREEIGRQYKHATGKDLHLTSEQLVSVYEAHSQSGKLGELSLGQLKRKVEILKRTIPDPDVRRFLLEAGFCGKTENGGLELPLVKKEKIDKLGIKVDKYNIEDLGEIEDEVFDKVMRKKEKIDTLGIRLSAYNIRAFGDMEDEIFDKAINKKEKIDKLGIEVNKYNIKEFGDMEDEIFDKAILKKEKIDKLGIEVTPYNIEDLGEIEDEIFDKVISKKEKIDKVGIAVKGSNMKVLAEVEDKALDAYDTILNIVAGANHYISLSVSNMSELVNVSIKGLRNILQSPYKTILNSDNIVLASQLAENLDISSIKEFLERKNRYLQKNRTLSQGAFDKLFRVKERNSSKDDFYSHFTDFTKRKLKINPIQGELEQKQLASLKDQHLTNQGRMSDKYGFGAIQQTSLGYCYAYTGFNLLQRSNFFEAMIQTSMRAIPGGREVTVPFGDKNGKRIKVSQDELIKEHDNVLVEYKDKATDEIKVERKKSKATSESSVGMQILEIAFIKQYIIANKNLGNAHYDHVEKEYADAIKQARKEYAETGDITLNGVLLGVLSGGFTVDWMEYMLGVKNIIKKEVLYPSDKNALYPLINSGLTKVGLGLFEDTKITTLDNKNLTIHTGHAYSLERVYLDEKTGEKVAVVSNPWYSHKKILMRREDCIDIFNAYWEVGYIDPNKLFVD